MSPLPPEVLPWVQGLAVVLVLGLGLALFVGVMLLARPRALFALNEWLSRSFDTAPTFRLLDQPRHVERFFYRHHRVVGALVVAGASYVLLRWAFAYDRPGVLALVSPRLATGGLDWVPLALEATLVGLHVAILAVGVLIMFRPSLLKGVEKAANRWQDGPTTTPLDSVVGNLDGTFEGHPRIAGVVLVVSAVWCLLALAPVVADLLRR
jgi:hypothetical protein